MTGQLLSHYRILSKIGAGGMGEVYRATDTRLGRDVALKVLPPDVARDPDRIARFQREAKALAALDHPGIVTVYSVEAVSTADGTVHFLFQGISNGVVWAPIFLALDPRLKTGLLHLGGLLAIPIHDTPMPPEIDAVHYAPRVTQPVLMLNGRNDAIFPYETSQVPLFRLFATPPQDKLHLTFPGGHSSFGWQNELIRASLDWLDRRLGPVTK